MRRAVLVATVYVAAAILLTWPLATQLTTHLGALEGAGDPYLNLWTLGWGSQAWLQDPLGTLAGRAFDAPIFHPATRTLTYSDHQLFQSLMAAPLVAWSGNLTLAYNLVLLTSLAASGVAMHVLARSVTGSVGAAFIAGLAWACWPYRTAHLLHLQLQALYFLPLALWALARVAAGRQWRDAGLLGVCVGLQAVVSVYYGVMTAVAMVLAAAALAWSTGQWRSGRYWSRVAAGAVLAGLLVVPVAIPYLRAQAAEGFGRNLYEASSHAASIQSYTQVPPDNALYGRTGVLAPRPPAAGERDRQHVEHQMFPGIVLPLLAVLGLWSGWRSDQRPIVVTAALLLVAGAWLSAGPEGPLGLYRLLASEAFGFEAIRAPARFAVLAMLGLALLAAVGVSRAAGRGLAAHRGGATAGVIAVTGLMLLEYANAPLAFVPAPATDTAVGRWLRDAPEPGAVAYLPVGLDRESTPLMIEALQHGRPIVNGYSGQRPGAYTAIAESLASLPGVEGRAMLKELDVRFVVARKRWPVDSAQPFVERAAFDEGIIYEVRWSPASEAALAEVTSAPPPPPGPAPFQPGEEARYAVRWMGDVPAGTISIRADAADASSGMGIGPAHWRFEAAANTADWVSRFFEARDVFATVATAAFEPLVHERQINEGARRLRRAYVFDRARRQVRVAASAEEALAADAEGTPLFPGARDAVSALFYARTLPLTVGSVVAIPVNDAGRNMTIRLSVEGVETLASMGGTVEALRLQVVIERRLERRQPVSARLWLSTDGRRVPVRLDLSAGFGQVRAELVDYRPW